MAYPYDPTQPAYYYLDGKYGKDAPNPDGGSTFTVFPANVRPSDFLNEGQRISQIEYEAAERLHSAVPDYFKIIRAVEMAVSSHWGQTRKTDDTPYIIHPFAVATLLTEITDDAEIISAALLHDVLEDGVYATPRLIRLECGERVLRLVQDVTEPKLPEQDRKNSWRQRKEAYLAHLQTAEEGALLICAADKIHNLRSLIDAYQTYGDDIWPKFNAGKEEKLWFYGAVTTVIRQRLDNVLAAALENAHNDAVRLFGPLSDTMGINGSKTKQDKTKR